MKQQAAEAQLKKIESRNNELQEQCNIYEKQLKSAVSKQQVCTRNLKHLDCIETALLRADYNPSLLLFINFNGKSHFLLVYASHYQRKNRSIVSVPQLSEHEFFLWPPGARANFLHSNVLYNNI